MFYKTLKPNENRKFKERKRQFKRGKPCAVCGRLLAERKMMVAHIRPASEIPKREALMNAGNWEVRCIECEQRLNREEELRKKKLRKAKRPKKPDRKIVRSRKETRVRRQQQKQREEALDVAMKQDVLNRFNVDMRSRRSKSRGKRRRDDYYAE